MNLEEKILEVLKEGQPLKGKEIAALLTNRYGLAVDKTEVNSLLYHNLRDKATQNKSYQWSLKKEGEKPVRSVNSTLQNNTPLAKLSNYYLECISKDMAEGISVYARSNYRLDYTQLTAFPGEGNADLRVDKHLLDKVRMPNSNFIFKLGYPILVNKLPGRQGGFYYKAEPVFVFTVDTESTLQNGLVALTDDDVVLNPEAIKSLTGINSASELMLEIVNLYEELGISNDPEDKPTAEDLVLRLQQLNESWKWRENMNVNQFSPRPVAAIDETGIYNTAAVFVAEKSMFTAGLEKDLKDLSKITEDEYRNSALGGWITNTVASTQTSDQVLIEPISLNEEQREAVLKGLASPLTVVTGPPGNGKTKGVANLIVNAIYQGQTVLLSSKNNKAVDVVNDRVNALSDRQVMLRLGRGKFQNTLAEYLSNLLSARPSADDQNRYNEAKTIHQNLLQAIEAIKKKQSRVIDDRNKVDQLEASVENYRQEVGAGFFTLCETLSLEKLSNIDLLLNAVTEKVNNADRTRQSILVKLLWSFLKESRFLTAKAAVDNLSTHAGYLQIEAPLMQVDDSSISIYRNYLQGLSARNKKAKEIK